METTPLEQMFYKLNFTMEDYTMYIKVEDELVSKFQDELMMTDTSCTPLTEEESKLVEDIYLVDDYCEEGLSNMHGSVELSRINEAINNIISYYKANIKLFN